MTNDRTPLDYDEIMQADIHEPIIPSWSPVTYYEEGELVRHRGFIWTLRKVTNKNWPGLCVGMEPGASPDWHCMVARHEPVANGQSPLSAIDDCPHCGSQSSLKETRDPDGYGLFLYVECEQCEAEGGRVLYTGIGDNYAFSAGMAVGKWNARVTRPSNV